MDKQLYEYMMNKYLQRGGRPGPISDSYLQSQIGGDPDVMKYVLDTYAPPPSGPMPYSAVEETLGPPAPVANTPAPMATPAAVVPAAPVAQQAKPDMGYMAAQIGQGLSEAASQIVSPGDILLGTKRSEPSQYISQYIAKKKLGFEQKQEDRAEKEGKFQEKLREAQLAKLDEENLIKKQMKDVNSDISIGRRAAIKAIYPNIETLSPGFNNMSAYDLERSMPLNILKSVQDADEARLRISADSDRLKMYQEEKKAITERAQAGREERKERQQNQFTENQRKEGVIEEKVAEQFRGLANLKDRTKSIEEEWNKVVSDTGPIMGRLRKALGDAGYDVSTSGLNSELGMAFADYVKSLSGAAVTDAEFRRLAANLAQTHDSPGRFKKLIDGWKEQQTEKLKRLALMEASKDIGNDLLRKNAEAMLRTIEPGLHIIKNDQGIMNILDENTPEGALTLKIDKGIKEEKARINSINTMVGDIKSTATGEAKVIILTNSGQKGVYIDKNKLEAYLQNVISKGLTPQVIKGDIIIDNRKFDKPQAAKEPTRHEIDLGYSATKYGAL